MSEEIKPDHGKNIAVFSMNLELDGNDNKFVLINRSKGQGRYAIVYKSEIKPKEQGKHKYNELTIDTSTLCQDNDEQEILFQFYRYSTDGNHKKISNAYTTLGELKANEGQSTMLSGDKGAKLEIVGLKVQPRVSFLDYIFGGCEIGLHVAIDFTLSNGDPNDFQSLHYLNPQGKNAYVQAIESVLGILQDYDTDQMYPVYGFGGKLPGAT